MKHTVGYENTDNCYKILDYGNGWKIIVGDLFDDAPRGNKFTVTNATFPQLTAEFRTHRLAELWIRACIENGESNGSATEIQ
jgi:hypothetical protein